MEQPILRTHSHSPLQVSIDAIVLAQKQAREASLKIEDSIQSSIVQFGIAFQVQKSYALANIESLDAVQSIFELESRSSFVNPITKRGFGQLSLYYQAMADDSEPKKVLNLLHELLVAMCRTDIVKDPEGYILQKETIQRKLEEATRNICNPEVIPVGHHSLSFVISSTNNIIKHLTSSWSDLPTPTKDALDRISKAFARTTLFQVELEVARCLLVRTVYEEEMKEASRMGVTE